MDYNKLIQDLHDTAKLQIGMWHTQNEEIIESAAKCIEDLLKYKEAIERMGSFGTLFVEYEGDPRGPVGRAGGLTLEEEAVIMPVITDADGGKWRPVNSDVLKDLVNRVVTEKIRAEKAEREKDAAIKELNEVASTVDEVSDLIDNEVHPVCDYNLYLMLRENVDAIAHWQYEKEWRGIKEE